MRDRKSVMKIEIDGENIVLQLPNGVTYEARLKRITGPVCTALITAPISQKPVRKKRKTSK